MAWAVCGLLHRIDIQLGHPAHLELVDIGAGQGELLQAVLELCNECGLTDRLKLVGVDLRARPAGLDARIDWLAGAAPKAVPTEITGLLIATELLDDVACEVVETDPGRRRRLVLVDEAGNESLGAPAGPASVAWLDRWWPGAAAPGARAEVGIGRDDLCRSLTNRVRAGAALFVDYPVASPAPMRGTLTGYRNGRQVRPVPDGSCNITAHVCFDACSRALAGLGEITLTSQHDVMSGVSGRPSGLSGVAQLSYRSQLAELSDPDGLGAHKWLTVVRHHLPMAASDRARLAGKHLDNAKVE